MSDVTRRPKAGALRFGATPVGRSEETECSEVARRQVASGYQMGVDGGQTSCQY